MLLGLLRWLDNNLEKLLVSKEITQDYQMAQQGIEIITPNQLKSKFEKAKSESKSEQSKQEVPDWILHQKQVMQGGITEEEKPPSSVEAEEGIVEEKEPEEPQKTGPKGPDLPTATAHKGTQMKIEGLKMLGIGILECTTLNIVMMCNRCRTQVQMTLTPKATYAKACEKCHQDLVASFRPGKFPLLELIEALCQKFQSCGL